MNIFCRRPPCDRPSSPWSEVRTITVRARNDAGSAGSPSAERSRPIFSSTTRCKGGLDADQARRLREHAAKVPIVWAPNMSVGVNLLLGLVEEVARTLDPAFDIEILEMHHRQKVDAPSGTALALGRAAARGRGVELDEVALRSRDGITGARPAGVIGFAVMRGGDVVGDHRVLFAGGGERLELAHVATDRRIYSRGAVRAALWAPAQAPGLYGMSEVLGLRRARPG